MENICKIQPVTSTNQGTIKELDIFHSSMRALYQKYVEVDCAPLEINISSRRRIRITKSLGKEVSTECVEEILNAMGCAVEEIISLLTEAAIRYATERQSISV